MGEPDLPGEARGHDQREVAGEKERSGKRVGINQLEMGEKLLRRKTSLTEGPLGKGTARQSRTPKRNNTGRMP